jgi:hypothetical protein
MSIFNNLNLQIAGAIALICFAQILRIFRWKSMVYKDGVISSQFISRSMSLAYALNLIFPFRIGELGRIFYLKKKDFNYTAVVFAIVIERIIDSVLLLLFFSLYIFIMDEVFQIYLIVTVLTVVSGLAVTLFIFKSKKIRTVMINVFSSDVQVRLHLAILQVYLSLTKLKINHMKVVFFSLIINLGIFSSILLFANGSSTKLSVIADILLFDLSNSILDSANALVRQSVGIGEILGLLLLPILVLILAGMRNRTSIGTSLADLKVKKIRDSVVPETRTLFNDAYLKEMIGTIFSSKETQARVIQEQILKNSRVLDVLQGGVSGELVFLLSTEDKLLVRKLALGDRKDFLKKQNTWMIEMKNTLPIVNVDSIVETENAAYFDMEYLGANSSFFDYLHKTDLSKSKDKISALLARLNTSSVENESSTIDKELTYFAIYEQKIRSCFAAISDKGVERYLSQPFQKNSQDVLPVTFMDIVHFLSTYVLPERHPWVSHGDLTVSNILIDHSGEIRLIDPNPYQPINHPTVDLAKLLQSFKCGFEFNFDNQNLSRDGEISEISDLRSHIYAEHERHIYNWIAANGKPADLIHANIQLLLHLLRIIPYANKLNQLAWLIIQIRIIYTELVSKESVL